MNFEKPQLKAEGAKKEFGKWVNRVARMVAVLAMIQVGGTAVVGTKAEAGEINVDNRIAGTVVKREKVKVGTVTVDGKEVKPPEKNIRDLEEPRVSGGGEEINPDDLKDSKTGNAREEELYKALRGE